MMKKCKVCGREYDPCKSGNTNPTTYRWQDVACCAEHGSQYLAEIIASRSSVAPKTAPSSDMSVAQTDVEQDDVEHIEAVAVEHEFAASNKKKNKKKPEPQA